MKGLHLSKNAALYIPMIYILCLRINAMMYIFMYIFSDLWIWNFHHSNFLLTNAFIYLHPMRLSLGKRPSQFLEYRYLLNETVFQEKKQRNYRITWLVINAIPQAYFLC